MASTPKIKVLWWSEIFASTGFATVAHALLKKLQATGKYDITVVGVLYYGEPHPPGFEGITVLPAVTPALSYLPGYDDKLGRARLLDLLKSDHFDIFFSLTDMQNTYTIGQEVLTIRSKLTKKFKWISYTPVDWTPSKDWVENGFGLSDYPVLYTHYAQDAVKKVSSKVTRIIPHGVDTTVFHPLSVEDNLKFKQEMFGYEHIDDFVVTNVNRNQPRKDIPRTIAAFSLFHKDHSASLLYLHMGASETGGNMVEVAKHFGLKLGKDVFFPGGFKWDIGYPIEVLNQIYNVSDVVVTTTLGEGWGMSLTEAMATKTPVVAPNNTSITEILDNGKRGFLIPISETDWLFHDPTGVARICPTVSVEAVKEEINDVWAFGKGKEMDMYTDPAYDWVQTITWDKVGDQWVSLFDEAMRKSVIIKP